MKILRKFMLLALTSLLSSGCIIVKQSMVVIYESDNVRVPVEIRGSDPADSLNGNDLKAKAALK